MARLAFVAGAVAAVVLVLNSKVAATPVGKGLEVRTSVNLTGRIGVAPYGTIMKADALTNRDGHDVVRGRTTLTNQTLRPVSIQVRARPALSELDDKIRVAVSLGGKPMADTTVGRFRRWVGWNMTIPPGASRDLVMRVRIQPEIAPADYVGRILELPLELRAPFVGAEVAS